MPTPQKYKSAKGTRWRIQYVDPTGARRTKTGFQTKKQAEHWAAQNIVDQNDGSWIDPTSGKVTVGQLGTEWMENQTHLKPSTMRVTESTWRVHVEPAWGHRPVASIRPSEVQTWVSRLDGGATTVRNAHGILAKILDVAVMDKRIPANPARGVKLPAKGKGVKVYLTAGQLHRLVDECGEQGDLIYLLGTSGIRFGEAVALRVKDIDFMRRRINIARNAVTVKQDVIIGTPKTGEERTVAVAEDVLAALSVRCRGKSRNDLLWTRRDGGLLRTLGHNSFFHNALRRIQADDPEFPWLTPHGLRHVAAGLMVSSGANVKVVQRQLGHASATMTLDRYADLFDDDLDGVAARMDEILARGGASNMRQMKK